MTTDDNRKNGVHFLQAFPVWIRTGVPTVRDEGGHEIG